MPWNRAACVSSGSCNLCAALQPRNAHPRVEAHHGRLPEDCRRTEVGSPSTLPLRIHPRVASAGRSTGLSTRLRLSTAVPLCPPLRRGCPVRVFVLVLAGLDTHVAQSLMQRHNVVCSRGRVHTWMTITSCSSVDRRVEGHFARPDAWLPLSRSGMNDRRSLLLDDASSELSLSLLSSFNLPTQLVLQLSPPRRSFSLDAPFETHSLRRCAPSASSPSSPRLWHSPSRRTRVNLS